MKTPLAYGLYGRSIAFDSVQDHPPLLAVIAKGVFPLSLLWHDAEPLLRLLFGRQLPIVLEDDRWRVATV